MFDNCARRERVLWRSQYCFAWRICPCIWLFNQRNITFNNFHYMCLCLSFFIFAPPMICDDAKM
ncbi:hypothetical protein COCMIDRAFT_82781 [Bipolaris oryzae ATCC 44560]|uniref:Uncharacterized protein n=1 Tax=Bipolaris oryzae ATCC 44560 TaxID=930090 RepID=W6ZRJ1_COCMI|nr:uncharacterized protein COCMIDRAFT_82781 [Bipolaris oryzae ATCC 44560]EUC50129.1 hypothetical protein COCMIDRAFT_82781 [Bipolaris oryzae ATCC 44560]